LRNLDGQFWPVKRPRLGVLGTIPRWTRRARLRKALAFVVVASSSRRFAAREHDVVGEEARMDPQETTRNEVKPDLVEAG
jgi:hypothetical protein